jgi:DNA-binding GntR family transcriptional regulator
MKTYTAEIIPPRAARSRMQLVRDQLEEDIVNGRLAPGIQLDIEELATRFEVSRTPVREALQQLKASGLVQVIPKRGTYVAKIGLPELIDMFDVMAELEAMCARLAARRATDSDVQRIEKALIDCEREATTGDANPYYYANEQFHQLIYQCCGNPYLVQQTVALKTRLKPYRRLQLQLRNRIVQSLTEHREIVQAIKSGDMDRAAEVARAHVLIQGQRFSDLMSVVERKTEVHREPQSAAPQAALAALH